MSLNSIHLPLIIREDTQDFLQGICSQEKHPCRPLWFQQTQRIFYFVAKWDGSGEHDFSRTNEEHTRKKCNSPFKMRLGKKDPDDNLFSACFFCPLFSLLLFLSFSLVFSEK
jgi:hypothetical protein